MGNFYWIWAYVSAFWTTLIVPCTTNPALWDRCSRFDEWLVPWVRDVTEMYQKGAYHAEKKILGKAE